ncbi:fibrinogen C domain-containing protein 1-B-like [Saccostrea echinata]|uniref:fibrinogen C domain-containing protein 1-B-like n=1 Tax=Saccostrea echinata TaxID=191078 RepID=UPI002A83C3C6|nr:fibrinogen C domain-containing protein 1-B-like [Saccostrea echinata]
MTVCFKFKLCRSVDWIKEEKTCRLNTRFAIKNGGSLMTKGHTFHVEREIFPTHLAGNCLNHSCTEDEICIAGKCVPVLKEKIYKDCSDIVKRDQSKKGQDGVYVIYPDTRREVFCDMTTGGGGWTVIQKRQDGEMDFYRTWIEYKDGFGTVTKNYWIGNDVIHALARDKNQELRIDLQRHNGEQAYAVYSTFYIGDENNKYMLTVSGYNGTAGDSLTYHNGMRFSTKDQDNDIKSDGSCSILRHGAWWYKNCLHSNLNGQYAQSALSGWEYPVWEHWKYDEALKKTVMMIRYKN